MKKKNNLISVVLLLISCFVFNACSDSDDESRGNLVEILKSNKWQYEYVDDYNESDYGDYFYTYTYRLYFMDNNVGYHYSVETENKGSSASTTSDFDKFTYEVVDNRVYIKYSGSDTKDLYTYEGGSLNYKGDIYTPSTMTQSDRDFVDRKAQEMENNKEEDYFINGHDAVDLGLSVRWATCNVGANSPEEYGDYFAWGETSPKNTYDWSTYKWCNEWHDGDSYHLTKYCAVDNKTQLEMSDDAARVNWGGLWRMPTIEEYEELQTQCTWIWTRQNGVLGRKVVSKINGNSIFLPAAGYWIYGSLEGAGSHGRYWSRSLRTYDLNSAMCLSFNSDDLIYGSRNHRSDGNSVRPVVYNKEDLLGEVNDAKIAANISQYVWVTCTFDKEMLLFRYTINSSLLEKYPQKSFRYYIEYGYGNLSHTKELNMSGKTEDTFELSVLFDEFEDDLHSYEVLRAKVDSGEKLPEREGKKLEELVSKIEATIKSFQATIFVSFGFENCNVYDDFVAEIDLDADYELVENEIINGHEAVDLGLSVKWAKCNVGADSPEDYGNYFAWGETTPKERYDICDWIRYKWCEGSYKNLTKYCTDRDYGIVDNKTQLDLADDAAHANWGSGWRMPTTEEQGELYTECTWTCTTVNGVQGYEVVSKKNGNSIFLPAAGCRYVDSLYYAGLKGCYWSSSLFSNPAGGGAMTVESNDVRWHGYERCEGLSVRPVCE